MSTIKALLIEDNPADARLISEMLSEEGGGQFDLEYAEDLSKGLERLSAGDTDVVILDLSLPESRGIETFTRANMQAPSVPIVLLTGLEDEALAVRLLKEGAQDYLVKGKVEGKLLARSIRYAIERKKLIVELQEALEEIKTLKGLIPICAWCKKVRDDKGYWSRLETYLKKRTGAEFTHGICPDCVAKLEKKMKENGG